jgi:hypothetical protein
MQMSLIREKNKMSNDEQSIANLATERAKLIIASAIKNEGKRQKFLDGAKSENYIINGINLGDIKDYDFNDGNIYLFENCLVKDIRISFKNAVITFEKCQFEGFVLLHNQGVGDDDIITVKDSLPSDDLTSLDVRSINVVFENSDLSSKNKIYVAAPFAGFYGCSLKAPLIGMKADTDCEIQDCDIDHLTSDYTDFSIENSSINGEKIGVDNESKFQK